MAGTIQLPVSNASFYGGAGLAPPNYTRVLSTNPAPVMGLAFDPTTDEGCFWAFQVSGYTSGNLSLVIPWYADTATSGTVTWAARIQAITADSDSQDVETDAMATVNFVQDTHIGTVGQRLHQCTITISNLDGLADGDWVRLELRRDAAGVNAADTMTGDAIIWETVVLSWS